MPPSPGTPTRIVLALALAALVAALVWPAPEAETGPRTVADVVAPLGVGRPVAAGYVLETILRGEEHDVLLVARRPGAQDRVEVHLVDHGHWPGSPETPSFGVDYEAPRSTAPPPDCAAVTQAIRQAILAHDPGELGPVDGLSLGADAPPAPPWVLGPLARLAGARGVLAGLALVAATWLLTGLPRGRLWTAAWLAALGLLLRLPALGLPFDRDQDVQRLFTGHLPLREILTGAGLRDRHPPLYFLVLHVAELFGQSETVARAPAALAGSLVGAAVLLAVPGRRGRAGPGAALVALGLTLSLELASSSRECSDIPLFALFAVAMSASLVRAHREPSRRWLLAVVASHALAMWTYYLAPLLVAGGLAMAWLLGLRRRSVLRAAGLGVLLGAPSLALEVAIFVRDSGARAAADAHPQLAWGKHGVAQMAGLLARQCAMALGRPLLVVVAVVTLFSLASVARAPRARAAVLVPLAAFAATFAGVALVAPFARVQPYYLDAVAPLAALAAAAGLPRRRGASLCAVAVGLAVALGVVPRLHFARRLYLPSRQAVMPALAGAVDAQPERRVLVTADYDTTILAYYLARRHGVPVDWDALVRSEDGIHVRGLPQQLVPLVRVHSPGPDPDGEAAARVDLEARAASVLVLTRPDLGLPRLDARLSRCEPLESDPFATLLRCR